MTLVPGFRFAGVAAGVKKAGSDRLDVGLIVADGEATIAGVFTKNRVKAAPVVISQARVRRGRARGLVVNAGNANACTGAAGRRDALAMTATLARALGAKDDDFCVASTGVIGQNLPMDRVTSGIRAAAAALSPDAFPRFAQAILTTDKGPKTATAQVTIGRRKVVLAGCTKGAGMIAPNMATTLTFVTTDAAIAPAYLRKLLRQTAEETFNTVLVDGDTSTNDSLFVLASGASGAPLLRGGDADSRRFATALRELLMQLAFKIVADGEGATKLVTFQVSGAATPAAAKAVARRIATSPLVKTAVHGADPNWGRILCAIGNAGVAIDPDKIDVDIGSVPIVRRGVGVMPPEVEARAHAVMAEAKYTVHVRLGRGKAAGSATTCDLTAEYVAINADYRS